MPEWVVEKISKALNGNSKSINKSKILILGISYKKDVDDIRESPAIIIIKKLIERGAIISYSDPHIPSYTDKEYSVSLKNISLTKETISSFDACVLITNHKDFDYQLIESCSQLIIDTRGVFSPQNPKVYRA